MVDTIVRAARNCFTTDNNCISVEVAFVDENGKPSSNCSINKDLLVRSMRETSQKQFTALKQREGYPPCSVLIFEKGSVIVVGLQDLRLAKLCILQVSSTICDSLDRPIALKRVDVVNTVSTFSMFKLAFVDLITFMNTYRLGILYVPDSFPGIFCKVLVPKRNLFPHETVASYYTDAAIRRDELGAAYKASDYFRGKTVLVFQVGKCTLLGASDCDIHNIFQMLYCFFVHFPHRDIRVSKGEFAKLCVKFNIPPLSWYRYIDFFLRTKTIPRPSHERMINDITESCQDVWMAHKSAAELQTRLDTVAANKLSVTLPERWKGHYTQLSPHPPSDIERLVAAAVFPLPPPPSPPLRPFKRPRREDILSDHAVSATLKRLENIASGGAGGSSNGHPVSVDGFFRPGSLEQRVFFAQGARKKKLDRVRDAHADLLAQADSLTETCEDMERMTRGEIVNRLALSEQCCTVTNHETSSAVWMLNGDRTPGQNFFSAFGRDDSDDTGATPTNKTGFIDFIKEGPDGTVKLDLEAVRGFKELHSKNKVSSVISAPMCNYRTQHMKSTQTMATVAHFMDKHMDRSVDDLFFTEDTPLKQGNKWVKGGDRAECCSCDDGGIQEKNLHR